MTVFLRFVGLWCLLILTIVVGCNNSELEDAIDSGEDLIGGIDRKPIDRQLLGINAFVNEAQFGSIQGQFSEVKNTLGINYVRVLFNWDNNVQPSPDASINFSFYDDIIAGLPSGIDALVVITGVPGWMSNSDNWVDGNPRVTFVERFVRRVVTRYQDSARIVGWQIWNEPNMQSNADNQLLGLAASPEQYVELLARAHSVSKSIAPSKLVLNAATTSINQNFPDTLNYNKRMVEAGISSFLDKYAIHYYGKQFENVVRSDGVADFLNSQAGAVWVTESGAQGVNNQLAYGEQVWPFLTENIGNIERIYIYQFTENSDAGTTYGLRNPSGEFPVSDLYVFLRG